jgi:hypothetical protein
MEAAVRPKLMMVVREDFELKKESTSQQVTHQHPS